MNVPFVGAQDVERLGVLAAVDALEAALAVRHLAAPDAAASSFFRAPGWRGRAPSSPSRRSGRR